MEEIRTAYNKWASIYDHTIRSVFDSRDMYFQELEKEFILSNIEESLNVLDVGAGTGRLTIQMTRYGAKVIGLDISESMLNVARKNTAKANMNGRIEFIQGSVHRLPFNDNTFDLITCIGILGHIPINIRKEVIHELARVLKPGGFLIIMVGNRLFENIPLPGARTDKLSSANPVDRNNNNIKVGGLKEKVEITWYRFYPGELVNLISTTDLKVIRIKGALFLSAWLPKRLLKYFPNVLRLIKPFEDFLSVLPPFRYIGYRTFLKLIKTNKDDT